MVHLQKQQESVSKLRLEKIIEKSIFASMDEHKRERLSTIGILATAVLLMLCSCLQRPEAGEFTAPELGDVIIKVDEYKASLSCTVLNVRDRETFGFKYGKEGEDNYVEVPAVPEKGLLKAEITGLDAPASYVVKAFASSGKNELSSNPKTFSVTQTGPAAVIPDPVFKRYCLANFDLNSDGKISVEEADRVTIINVCTDSISSVKGIEFFPNLLELHARGGMVDGEWIRKGNLMSLDVSGNSNLRIIDCEDNRLREIDLSHNPELRELNVGWNYLSSVDVSMLPLLTNFNISVNESISSVDVTHNPGLLEYHANNLNLTELPDLTKCKFLMSIHMGDRGGGVYLDRPDYFSAWPDMFSVNLGGYTLEEIDFTANKRIEGVWADGMPNMVVFDLSPLVALQRIDVNNCPALKTILVNENVDISSLKIKKSGTGELEIKHKMN